MSTTIILYSKIDYVIIIFRLKITHNIAILFIKMGQYSDAATSFEFIMSEKGDLKSGLHLILCYYALGDIDKMKSAFQLLLDVQIDYNDDEKIINPNVRRLYLKIMFLTH